MRSSPVEVATASLGGQRRNAARTIIRHLFLVHVGVAIAVVICLAIPTSIVVVLKSLWTSLAINLGPGATFRLVLGTIPTSMYLMAPVACVIAICWLFRVNSENGSLSAMYAAGTSVTNCAAPAILLALLFTLASYALAWVVAPFGVTMVENVKHEIGRHIDVDALAEGQFHTIEFGDRAVTLFFGRNRDNNELEQVFLSVKSKNKARVTIVAKKAIITKEREKIVIIFFSGNRQTLDDTRSVVFVEFRSYTLMFPMRALARQDETLLEMDYRELVQSLHDATASKNRVGKVRSELAKRFLAPAMSLGHALFALGILFSIGPVRTLSGNSPVWLASGLIAVHVSSVAVIEVLARISFLVHWLIATAILVELLVGVALLLRSGQTLRAVGWPGFVRRIAGAAQ